ncbi:hypothetical protein AX16_009100 [Volvariella volvacea WC 439]|nr:hypothetical protein AX16_009100 [Volvariella volvacea WC 439]
MRFRTSVSNVPTFFKIMQAIEKLQKSCVIKFTETTMHIICNSEANAGGVQVWSQIKVDSLFSGYRIQSNSNNEITMSLSTEALLTALRSAFTTSSSASSYEADEVVMKLAKKDNQAVLSFEIKAFTRLGRRAEVNHAVRIEVMRPSEVEKMNEPLCPEPDLHILLPSLQKLRTIAERLRPMSDVLAVRANNNGRLQLAINTDSVRVETEWRNCTHPRTQEPTPSQHRSDDGDKEPRDPDQMYTVFLSTRSFIKFLNSHVVSTTTIACICQHHCMILYVYIGDVADAGGVLTYYIPAIIDDEN